MGKIPAILRMAILGTTITTTRITITARLCSDPRSFGSILKKGSPRFGEGCDISLLANIADETLPLRWTGKIFPKEQALRKFVFARTYQLRHVNGLTFDFLYEMAKKLHDSNSMMLLGGGEKGSAPLVMTNNGTPYRGFLEGRINGDSFCLLLHLTNLELKGF